MISLLEILILDKFEENIESLRTIDKNEKMWIALPL